MCVQSTEEKWHRYLVTESRSRKVIVVENPLLPDPIKRIITDVLLDNLQVRSMSFASSPVLSLMASGRTTGLVVDVGFHESTVIPVCESFM